MERSDDQRRHLTLPRDQADELARLLRERARRRARANLMAYVTATYSGYEAAAHLTETAELLEALERGDIDRLMITMPPRHGKSLLTSQRFPAWYMGRRPRDEIIHASYGGELVAGFGRRLRNLMAHQDHLEIFPEVGLSADSKAANLWHTSSDGVYCAAGVGGAITGRGAHLLLIDDPVKSREEAESERMRERVWDWYQNDAYSRLMPGGRVVIISTRWHEDDLSGRLLESQRSGGDQWTVLHHPALDADGEPLWPERYDSEALDRIRANVGPRAWQALYQGDPTPEDGSYFTAENIRRGMPPPTNTMRIYGASDYAVTEDAGDWTVHIVVGLDPEGKLWVLDLWRQQTTPDRWLPALIELMRRWRPLLWAEETAQIEKAVGPFLNRGQREAGAYVRRMQFSSARAKDVKARAIQGYIFLHGLWLPEFASWSATVEQEALKFPRGKNDDIVDCLSLVGRMLEALEVGRERPVSTVDPALVELSQVSGLALNPDLPGLTFDELARRN